MALGIASVLSLLGRAAGPYNSDALRSDDGLELVEERTEEFEEWVQVEDAPDEVEFILVDNPQ